MARLFPILLACSIAAFPLTVQDGLHLRGQPQFDGQMTMRVVAEQSPRQPVLIAGATSS